MIYNGTSTATTGTSTQISTSRFNSSENASYYVGLSYSTTQHGTGTASTILTALNNWYNGSDSGNLATNYGSYIDSNAGFCSDRNTASGSTWVASGSSFDYAAAERLNTNKSPSLACSSSDILNIPVGLITADEVAYAGGVYATSNTSYYLYTKEYYWTMSPSHFDGSMNSNADGFIVYTFGRLSANYLSRSYGVRPVINLKADTLFTGSGTSTDSFVVV